MRASPLALAEKGHVVCKRHRDGLDDLSRFQRFMLYYVFLPFARFCFLTLKLPIADNLAPTKCPHCKHVIDIPTNGARLDIHGVYTGEDRARAEAKKIGGFVHSIDVNADALPDRPALYGRTSYPGQPFDERYLKASPDTVTVGRDTLEKAATRARNLTTRANVLLDNHR